MTDNYLPASTPPQRGEPLPPAPAEEQGTADVVKDQASDLSHSSIQTGKHVADVAREQASGVAVEAGRQGRDLLHQAQGQLEEQAAQGQQRLANQLLSLSDELRSMAGASGQGGMAASLASQAASRVRNAGQWLDDRKPGQVADEMQSFARRRPGGIPGPGGGSGPGGRPGSPEDLRTQIAIIPRWRLQRRRGLASSGPSRLNRASYPPATAAGVSDQTPGLSAPASGLPPVGGDLAWEAAPAYGERSPLVTDDQAGRQGTL